MTPHLRTISSSQVIAETAASQAPLQKEESLPDVNIFLKDLRRAAAWNHGQEGKVYDKSLWDPPFCRSVVDRYGAYLRAFTQEKEASLSHTHLNDSGPASSLSSADQARLLQAETVELAFKALLKGHYEPPLLSRLVRNWERSLGQLHQTELTDYLTLRLLTANGKAGNVGRALSLLQFRQQRNYKPRRREFLYAIRSLQASQWARRQSRRSPFAPDAQHLDNPTRWLDTILINMHQRNFPLDMLIANCMLECFATGPTGRAVHHFYRVMRKPVVSLPPEERPSQTAKMPKKWVFVPRRMCDEDDDDDDDLGSVSSSSSSSAEMPFDDDAADTTKRRDTSNKPRGRRRKGKFAYEPVKVQLRYHPKPPPFYKVPSVVRGRLLKPRSYLSSQESKLRLDRENEPNYSYPLAAAFSFCDSIQHGACGHPGIELNVRSYNLLIKCCVQRGALWRAMHILDETMTCPPNSMSFNLILAGLARVGDVTTAQDYYMKMLSTPGVSPDAFTVRAIVDGLLNLGDLSSAVTVVQDFFNQHCVLPPYTTHTKVMEFCLARDMVHEAKRYVSFLQQLWKWEPNAYHSEEFKKLMKATQQNEQLQREALEQLFAYFGEELKDSDFF